MDIILGALVAALLVALCIGAGLAVRSAVDGLMGLREDDRKDADDGANDT